MSAYAFPVAPRRVRTRGAVRVHVDRWGDARVFLMVEAPRVSSRCAGRPDVWEWRACAALELGRELLPWAVDA